jgi:hypothetical protein
VPKGTLRLFRLSAITKDSHNQLAVLLALMAFSGQWVIGVGAWRICFLHEKATRRGGIVCSWGLGFALGAALRCGIKLGEGFGP